MIVVLGLATTGAAASLVAAIVAAGNTGTDLTPYVGGAGSGIAVIGLIYVLRALLSGALVARPVAEVEAKLFGLVADSQAREEAFEEIAGRMGFGSLAKKTTRRPR